MAKERKTVKLPTEGTQLPPVQKEEKPQDIEAVMKSLSDAQAQAEYFKNKLKGAIEQIQFLSQGEVHKRLDWLWKVITLEGAEDIFGREFYDYCVKDFKEIMTPNVAPEQPEE